MIFISFMICIYYVQLFLTLTTFWEAIDTTSIKIKWIISVGSLNFIQTGFRILAGSVTSNGSLRSPMVEVFPPGKSTNVKIGIFLTASVKVMSLFTLLSPIHIMRYKELNRVDFSCRQLRAFAGRRNVFKDRFRDINFHWHMGIVRVERLM